MNDGDPVKRDHFHRKGLSEQTIILEGLCEFSGVEILKNWKVFNLIKMFLTFSEGLKPLIKSMVLFHQVNTFL